jgi:outer membrane protein OmpA-like peptidoglycan-associated protein
MKKATFILFSIVYLSILTCAIAIAAEPDAQGCKDHSLFTRMTGYYIKNCDDKDFDRYTFYTDKGKEVDVEGHYTMIWYEANEGVKIASPLAIIRNYQQAIKRVGGNVLFEDSRYTSLKFAKNGKEIWALIDTAWSGGYQIHLVEKQEMTQEIVADAQAFSNDLKDTGHTAVYGIYFDTGQSVIKPESEAALAEIAKLIKGNADLKLNVVGHTDNVGGIDSNMRLSQARANAVVQALVGKYGIAAIRLKTYGVGSLAPVASNDTEEGKARNRRVELVKQ